MAEKHGVLLSKKAIHTICYIEVQYMIIRFVRYCCPSIVALIFCCVEGGEVVGITKGCVPPFTHSVVSRAVQLMMPTVS
jgi:hypothetical protein